MFGLNRSNYNSLRNELLQVICRNCDVATYTLARKSRSISRLIELYGKGELIFEESIGEGLSAWLPTNPIQDSHFQLPAICDEAVEDYINHIGEANALTSPSKRVREMASKLFEEKGE